MKLRSLGLALSLLLAAPAAQAADEVTTLETQLTRETTELSTSDCAVACKALASIRRAADRICELEPGPRCEAARSKAEDATRRVREACPTCTIAQLTLHGEDQKAHAPAPAPADAPVLASERGDSRGGCRNCATSSGAPDRGDLAEFGLAVALLGVRLGRRSKKDRRDV